MIPALITAETDAVAVFRWAIAADSEAVEVFDVFRGASIPEGHKSLAFHVVYRDPRAATDPEKARTLTDEEVDKKNQAVLTAVSQRFGATLRA